MIEAGIRSFAPKLGITDLKPKNGNGWMEARCPLSAWTHEKGHDRRPSFAIKVNPSGRSIFACQGCHHKGSFALLAYKLYHFSGHERYQELGREIDHAETKVVAASLPQWDEHHSDVQQENVKRTLLNRNKTLKKFPLAIFYGKPVAYLRKRGISFSNALKLGIRYDYAEDRVVFPVFDHNQELRGMTGRAMHDGSAVKVKDYFGLNKIELFLGEHHVFKNRHKYKYVIIVEGLFDYAKLYACGYTNVMALLGSQLTKPKYEKLVSLNLPVIWMTDNDAAGYDCLYGRVDKETDERDERTGALYKLRDFVPQFLVEYPKSKKKNDPGSLSKQQIDKMIANIEMYA